MQEPAKKRDIAWKTIAKGVVMLAVFGGLSYAMEHWGGRYMSRVSDFVADQGRLGPVVFVILNALATMCLVPQILFTVIAGALFGWKFGTVYASVAMTAGATAAFFIARYGVREWIRARFEGHAVFRKMQRLSRTHPFHVISLSRIIPVLPFPVTSYLLGVTEVRSLPYALLTWACMLPETLFLASGGHLLHSGITGKASIEAAVIFVVVGVGFAVVVHRTKKRIMESDTDD
ncbi:TVP38/TMEM64 family protein [uncultured Pseudodesulfovibrio sp.]|uniref:TVP38/TMEM64 family protein n=1 Tax=uncultured Pseudodesulfovibrio sp. TaxID=2035858 RepID=UPI0029C79C7F|nr:TVP38/TMEM64 family protein [uncultured Pseudodesulfovibrio sp.]